MPKYLFPILLVLLVAGLVFANTKLDAPQSSNNLTQKPEHTTTAKGPCTPTFADGGGPYYKENVPMKSTLAPETTNGERLRVTGKVLKNDCTTPLSHSILDVWHADETGEYQDNSYRGKVKIDKDGNYSFETVIPKGYGEGTGYRPPHIHFKVWDGPDLLITSQMFFPEAQGKAGFDDAYIMKVESKEENGKPVHYATHNIIVP
jgi:protocatechuate 3,4-dioxygenase beta subunit